MFYVCKEFGKIFIKQKKGTIVNIGSNSGLIVDKPQPQASYNASKAAVHQLTKSLACEWSKYNIRVNAIAPGYVATEMTLLGRKKPHWFKYWIEIHFFYKIFEFIIITFLSFIIIYIYFTKHKSEIDKKHNQNYIFLILCALSIFFWLITVPQFRFGFASLMLFLFIFLRIIFKKKILFSKKKFFILFFLSLLVLYIKNVNRIASEIQRNDFYKYNNFPYFNEKEIINNYKNLDRSSILHIEILK